MKAPAKKVRKAVEREMPGYVVKKKPKAPRRASAAASTDAVSPDLETLRRRYLGGGAGADAAPASSPKSRTPRTHARSRYDDEIVPVEPKDRSRDGRLPSGSRAKRVVYSGDSDEIIGRQG